MYLDVNNLYRHSMMQLLPIGIIDWVNPIHFYQDNYPGNGPRGFFLTVDLDHPDVLHDLHNDDPLAPEKVKISKEMFSEFLLHIMERNKCSLGKNEKLVLNLGNKKNKQTPL